MCILQLYMCTVLKQKPLELCLMPLVGWKSFSALVVKTRRTVIYPLLQREKGTEWWLPILLPTSTSFTFLHLWYYTLFYLRVALHPSITRHGFLGRVSVTYKWRSSHLQKEIDYFLFGFVFPAWRMAKVVAENGLRIQRNSSYIGQFINIRSLPAVTCPQFKGQK